MAEFRRTWRSGFWNSALALVFGVFVLVGISSVVYSAGIGNKVFYAVLGLLGLMGAWRALIRRVEAGPDGLRMVSFFSSSRIPWDAVERVELGTSTSGLLPSYAPEVYVSRKLDTALVAGQGPGARVELSVLSSYAKALPARAAAEIGELARARAT